METVGLLDMQSDWRTLARFLFVKGKTWENEKEVRLLVDQQETRWLDMKDENGLAIKVIDVPFEAIEAIYVAPKTTNNDIRELKSLLANSSHTWQLRRTSSHAYRMQVTSTELVSSK